MRVGASLGAAVLEGVFGGLLVSLKALDNKEHFFFSVETEPSFPEAGSCPLHLSPPLPCPPVLPASSSVSFGMFSSCDVLFSHLRVSLLRVFKSSSRFFFCFPFIFLCLAILPLLSPLLPRTPPTPAPKHAGLESLELPHCRCPQEQEETQTPLL